MFVYTKKLQYPVKIEKPNPKLARIIITQYGGPDGELGASLRYLSQRFSMPFDELKGLLTDIGTEASKCIWIGVFPSLGFPKKQIAYSYRIISNIDGSANVIRSAAAMLIALLLFG